MCKYVQAANARQQHAFYFIKLSVRPQSFYISLNQIEKLEIRFVFDLCMVPFLRVHSHQPANAI